MKVEQPPQRSPAKESTRVNLRRMRLCAKNLHSEMVIVRIAYPQKSASAGKQNTTRIALALLVLSDVMNAMLCTFLTEIGGANL
jgi:hypothetical protein